MVENELINWGSFLLTAKFPLKNLSELKQLYRKASFNYHPDRGGTVEQFQILSQVYTEISQKISNPDFFFAPGNINIPVQDDDEFPCWECNAVGFILDSFKGKITRRWHCSNCNGTGKTTYGAWKKYQNDPQRDVNKNKTTGMR